MGSSTSRPAPEPAAASTHSQQSALYEKQRLSTAAAAPAHAHVPSTPNHHAADRLERIAAESARGHRKVHIGMGDELEEDDDDDLSARPASAPVRLGEIKKWQDKVENVSPRAAVNGIIQLRVTQTDITAINTTAPSCVAPPRTPSRAWPS